MEFDSDKQRKLAAALSLLVGVILLIIKVYAYKITQSHAILSDAMESVINILSAIVAIIVIAIAAKPADREHPYGHGKVEYFASAFEGGAISLAGILIIIEAINALTGEIELKQLNLGLWIIFGAGIANGLLGLYLKHIGKKHHSKALYASGVHVLTDFISSVGIMLGLVVVHFTGIIWLDPVIAVLVGLQLSLSGFKLLTKSGSDLMDGEDIEVIRVMKKHMEKNAFPGIIRFHYMRAIRSGRYHHFDVHMVVPEFWSVEEAHEKSEEFEELVMKDYDMEGEFHFHLDPCRKKYCQVCALENCSIRIEDFSGHSPHTIEELISPTTKSYT